MFCNDIILLFHKHKQNKSVNFRLRAYFCIIMKPLHFHRLLHCAILTSMSSSKYQSRFLNV